MDRSEINRALSKAIAYKQCGKGTMAAAWAAELVRLLECADILNATGERLIESIQRQREHDEMA